MVSSSRIALVASFAAGIALTVSSQAHAAGNEPAPSVAPAQPAPAVNADKPQDMATAPELKQFSLELNPLAATTGRYSVQVEFLPVAHHAIVLNPQYTHFDTTLTVDLGTLGNITSPPITFSGFGGELGYRFYTGEKGANGLYVGPSFIFGSYSAKSGGADDKSFTAYGGALDVGIQGIVGPGIVIGGGVGVQYVATSEKLPDDLNLATKGKIGGGVSPRFLLSVGYSF